MYELKRSHHLMNRNLNTRLLLFRKKYQIPDSHVNGVRILVAVPSWGKLGETGKVFYQRGRDRWEYSAYYDDKKKDIFVPGGLRPEVLIHEIGHHVTMQKPKSIRKKVKTILKEHFTDRFLRHLGLVRYSVFSELEFLADCYKVLKLGTPEKKRNLIRFCKAHNLDILNATTI